MSAVTFVAMGREYRIAQPLGSKAGQAFHHAIRVMEESGAMAILDSISDAEEGMAGLLTLRAARKLATHKDAEATVRRTLIGGKIDDAAITSKTFSTDYTERGRQIEPHFAAVLTWDRMGFFSAIAKKDDAVDDESKKKLSTADQSGGD